MTANGNTIKAGLKVATDITVTEILNTSITWPWAESRSSPFRVVNSQRRLV